MSVLIRVLVFCICDLFLVQDTPFRKSTAQSPGRKFR
jgi:hypothetical protein